MRRAVSLLLLISAVSASAQDLFTTPKLRTWPGTENDKLRARKQRLQVLSAFSVREYERVADKTAPGYEEGRKALEAYAKYYVHPFLGFDAERAAMRELFAQAKQAGCRDPLFLYFYEDESDPALSNRAEKSKRYQASIDGMIAKKYHAIPRLFARRDMYKDQKGQPLASAKTLAKLQDDMWMDFEEAAKDHSMPAEIALLKFFETFHKYESPKNTTGDVRKAVYDRAMKALENAKASEWLQEAIKGEYHTDAAWDARGIAVARLTSDEQFEQFQERLEIARKSLAKADKLEPHRDGPARRMIAVVMGLGEPVLIRNLWFERAMVCNPDDIRSCTQYATSLQKKWGAPDGHYTSFIQACSQNENWESEIPTVPLRMIVTSGLDFKTLSANLNEFNPWWSACVLGLNGLQRAHPDDPNITAYLYCLNVLGGDTQKAQELKAKLPPKRKFSFFGLPVDTFEENFKAYHESVRKAREEKDDK